MPNALICHTSYLEQPSDNDSGVLCGSVLGQPSNRRTAKFVAKFNDAELLSFGAEGIDHVSATSPVVKKIDDRPPSNASSSGWNPSNASSSGWNDPDVMSTPSQNRTANTYTDPGQNGTCLILLTA